MSKYAKAIAAAVGGVANFCLFLLSTTGGDMPTNTGYLVGAVLTVVTVAAVWYVPNAKTVDHDLVALIEDAVHRNVSAAVVDLGKVHSDVRAALQAAREVRANPTPNVTPSQVAAVVAKAAPALDEAEKFADDIPAVAAQLHKVEQSAPVQGVVKAEQTLAAKSPAMAAYDSAARKALGLPEAR